MKAFLGVGCLWAGLALAQSPHPTTYCNPMDIAYRYNFEQLNDSISYRSGADPVIVNHSGTYYLFLTLAGGYWQSKDLGHWTFITPSRWPFEGVVAPAAISVRDTLYLLQSTDAQRPILFSTAPETGRMEFYNRWLPALPRVVPYMIGAWDPAFFYDEDRDEWYLYWGSSNDLPLFGIRLDKRKNLAYTGDPVPLLELHPDEHGWERFGYDHRDTIRPFKEGAWMTKYRGKYYLQYSGPGTEYNVYANATYVGDAPLGPFRYAPYNPISYKPGGFMTGVGHGNTFQDHYGNYWNTGTPWIAVNWNFERRIAMFPAGFDADDELYVNTRFGDFPHYLPTKKWTTSDELFTGWMLLSYRKPCTASSTLDTMQASRVTDENPRTFWVAQHNREGEWLQLDLQREMEVRAVQVNYTDYRSNLYSNDSNVVYTQFRLSHSRDGRTWQPLADLTHDRRDRPNAYVELEQPVRTRYLRYEHVYVGSPHLAISDFRVFGYRTPDRRKPPKIPTRFMAIRDQDARNVFVSWKAVPGVVGYNIRWGIASDKLYQAYQIFADQPTQKEIRALNIGQAYYFAIEAFDENGVSSLSEVVHVP
ncbi:F5/8 type C domain-containing protein [Catalinimonas alkaloidigena]|uniref:F5/8 type C domain-containing protein n=1 Tax=Catalinimonas alkaloidigena TaxID=1075417 RepID=A0A1G8XL81_9BACT|nr:discoidin domain-containing protein [Catalinimonas alkaloidigena]SDJ91432.1 F5/8 type C domain-containing protein [Catalinimonas alkaloidigena]